MSLIAVVGGAGFIGSNLAESYLAEGRRVRVIDNLSRPGVETNLTWLQARHGERLETVIADLRDTAAINEALEDACAVFHLAAQVAVTTSLAEPVADFEINARGTLNVLEAVRRAGTQAPVIFASTNKVYGTLTEIALTRTPTGHLPRDADLRAHGIGERQPLDFCTPYGCSKGVADQYVLDYGRSFGIPTAVMRMSCIYGPRQFGTEDQGWVAHFLLRALAGEAITLYGDGEQVRDILHVSDAVAAYRRALERIDRARGHAFNLGGGPANAVSLKQVLAEIGRLIGEEVRLSTSDWREGDQLYFVADTRKIADLLDWKAAVSWREGIADLFAWLERQRPDMASRRPEALPSALSETAERRQTA